MPYKDPDVQRKYTRNWMRKRRQAWIISNGPCIKCGSWENLEIDHKDPKQKISHNIWSWSQERREAELVKCQVLCRNCHIKKTIEENYRPIKHGTHNAYANGCRCSICRQAHREYCKAWRQALREKMLATM